MWCLLPVGIHGFMVFNPDSRPALQQPPARPHGATKHLRPGEAKLLGVGPVTRRQIVGRNMAKYRDAQMLHRRLILIKGTPVGKLLQTGQRGIIHQTGCLL